jgi:hypothetical protein
MQHRELHISGQKLFSWFGLTINVTQVKHPKEGDLMQKMVEQFPSCKEMCYMNASKVVFLTCH